MLIALVVATGKNGEIGRNGDLMWRLPADMARFREITMGHTVMMGRKTYESIPEKFRPLPGRRNLVVSRKTDYQPVGAEVLSSVEGAIDFAERNGEQELMVIGGGEVYRQCLPKAHKIYLTRINAAFLDADTFFPPLTEGWVITSNSKVLPDEKNAYEMEFIVLDRIEL